MESEADICQRHLAEFYLYNYEEVQLDPGDPAKVVHIKTIYTNLELIQDNKRATGKVRKPLDDYTELLNYGDGQQRKLKRLIIRGDPGKGKTTMAHKMAYDWAETKYLRIQEEQENKKKCMGASLHDVEYTPSKEASTNLIRIREDMHGSSNEGKEVLASVEALDQIQTPVVDGSIPQVETIEMKEATEMVDNPLDQFKLFILLRCRDLSGDMDLVDAIFDQLLPTTTTVTKEGLWSFIRAKPESICVCLEALDEKREDMIQIGNTGNIANMVLNQVMRQSLLIITSRPSSLADLQEQRMSYTEAEITGFTTSNIDAYIDRYFQNNPDEDESKVYELMETIHRSSSLSKFANNPLILYLICLIWSRAHKLPDTLSQIYEEAIEYMVKRHLDKHDSSDEQDNIDWIMNAIGRIGIDGLTSSKNRVTFDEAEFPSDVLQYTCKIGILSKDKTRAGLRMRTQVEFLHKSIQEYCAARYWKYLAVSDSQEFNRYLSVMTESTKRAKDFLYVLQFGCCQNRTSAVPILQKLSSLSENKGDIGETEEIFLLCYFEAQVGHLCSLNLSDWLFAEKKVRFLDTIVLHNRTVNLIRGLIYLLKSCASCDTCKDAALKITSLNINGLPEESAKDLKDLLGYLPAIDCLELFATAPLEYEKAWILGLSDQAELMTEINQLPLQFLFVGYFNIGSSVTKLLSYTKHLKTLKMINCFFMDQVTDPQEFSADLNVLDLTSTDLSKVGARALLGLNQMKNLQKLSLGLCSLEDAHIPLLTQLLPTFHSILILDVSHNYFGPESLCLVLKSISRLRLREVYATESLQAHDVLRFFHDHHGKDVVCQILEQMSGLEVFLLDSFKAMEGNDMTAADYEGIIEIGTAHPALLRFRLPGLNMERKETKDKFEINDEYGIKALDAGGLQHMFSKDSLARLSDPEKDLLAAKTTRLMLSMTPEKLQESMEARGSNTDLTTEQVGLVVSSIQEIFLSTNPLEALQLLQSVAESDDEEYNSDEEDDAK